MPALRGWRHDVEGRLKIQRAAELEQAEGRGTCVLPEQLPSLSVAELTALPTVFALDPGFTATVAEVLKAKAG
jgi:hypothetical protein